MHALHQTKALLTQLIPLWNMYLLEICMGYAPYFEILGSVYSFLSF